MAVPRTRDRFLLRLGVCVAAPALLAAACGTASSTSSNTSAPRAASSAAGGMVTVQTRSGGPGTYLTDGSGRTVYLFASDTAGKSTCAGACAAAWPPLTATGVPTAGGSAKSSLLSTITRPDGSKQVAYAGHPLYYYAADRSAGDTQGQGVDGFGAKWWVLSPDGSPITATSSSKPSPSKSPSSSSGGGWA